MAILWYIAVAVAVYFLVCGVPYFWDDKDNIAGNTLRYRLWLAKREHVKPKHLTLGHAARRQEIPWLNKSERTALHYLIIELGGQP